MVHFIRGLTCGWQVNCVIPLNTCHLLSEERWFTTMRYTNRRLLYFTYLLHAVARLSLKFAAFTVNNSINDILTVTIFCVGDDLGDALMLPRHYYPAVYSLPHPHPRNMKNLVAISQSQGIRLLPYSQALDMKSTSLRIAENCVISETLRRCSQPISWLSIEKLK